MIMPTTPLNKTSPHVHQLLPTPASSHRFHRMVNYLMILMMSLTAVSLVTHNQYYEWETTVAYTGTQAWLYPDSQIRFVSCAAVERHVLNRSLPARMPLQERVENALNTMSATSKPSDDGCYVRYSPSDIYARLFCHCQSLVAVVGSEFGTIQGATYVYATSNSVPGAPVYTLAVRAMRNGTDRYQELSTYLIVDHTFHRLTECGKSDDDLDVCETVRTYAVEATIFERAFPFASRMISFVRVNGTTNEWLIVDHMGQHDRWFGLGETITMYQPLGDFVPQTLLESYNTPTKPAMGWEGFAYQNVRVNYDYGFVAFYTLHWVATLVISLLVFHQNQMPTANLLITVSRLGSFNIIAIQQIVAAYWIFDRINVKRIIHDGGQLGGFEVFLLCLDTIFIFLAELATTLVMLKALDPFRHYRFAVPWLFVTSLAVAIVIVLVVWCRNVTYVEHYRMCAGYSGCFDGAYTEYYVGLVVAAAIQALAMVLIAAKLNQKHNGGVHNVFFFFPYKNQKINRRSISAAPVEVDRAAVRTTFMRYDQKLSTYENYCVGCDLTLLQTDDQLVLHGASTTKRWVKREAVDLAGFAIVNGVIVRLKDAIWLAVVSRPMLRSLYRVSSLSLVAWPMDPENAVQPPERAQFAHFVSYMRRQTKRQSPHSQQLLQ